MILGSQMLFSSICKHTKLVSRFITLIVIVIHGKFKWQTNGYVYASENGQKLINLKHFNCRIFNEIRWKWNEIKSDEKKNVYELYDNKLLSQFLYRVTHCGVCVCVSFKCPFNINLSNQFDAFHFIWLSLTLTLLLLCI